MSEQNLSRRSILGGAVLGAAAMASPAGAQSMEAAVPEEGRRLSDPRTKYTSEPFPEQKQPWPGLQSRMNPVPDCGETSYRGSGRPPLIENILLF